MSKDALRISVENIQAVAEATLEVVGFTGIVGRSNSGKSALIRAAQAAITNKASKALFRNGTKSSKVTISDEAKGIHFEWKKGENVSPEYTIGTEKYKGGKERPVQLTEWGFGDVKVNETTLDVQFAKQHEYLFLINESGSFVADFISKITKVDVITGAVKDCESDLRKTSESVKNTQEQIDEIAHELSRYENLDYHGSQIKNLFEAKKELHALNAKLGELDRFIEQSTHLRNIYSQLQDIPPSAEMVFDLAELNKVNEWVSEIQVGKARLIAARKVDQHTVPEAEFDFAILKDIQDYLSLSEKAALESPEVPNVEFDFGLLRDIESDLQSYDTLLADLQKVESDSEVLAGKTERLLKEQHEVEAKLGKCPTCKKEFGGDHEGTHGGRHSFEGPDALFET